MSSRFARLCYKNRPFVSSGRVGEDPPNRQNAPRGKKTGLASLFRIGAAARAPSLSFGLFGA
jgi:hypothetical protein